ncbi:progranulin-like [Vanacampus margaritifer]
MLRLSVWLAFGAVVTCNVTCPDETICPEYTTCCQTKQGYSCCGYPDAVCCPDLAHCCPRGFRCNLASQLCERVTKSWLDSKFQPMLDINNIEKTHVQAEVDASGSELELGTIRCSSQFFCPQGTSCCKGLSPESWNCCPYPLGQCCADGQHCCEYGYTCNISPLSCSRRNMNPTTRWIQEPGQNAQ